LDLIVKRFAGSSLSHENLSLSFSDRARDIKILFRSHHRLYHGGADAIMLQLDQCVSRGIKLALGIPDFRQDHLIIETSRRHLDDILIVQSVVLQVSNADKFVVERLLCVLRLPNRKGCR
jgi:hypothetical protein